MLKIRLALFGKKHKPFYRISVATDRDHKNAKAFAIIGTYDSKSKDLKFNVSKYKEYIALGAQPSQTVINLYKLHTRNQQTV